MISNVLRALRREKYSKKSLEEQAKIIQNECVFIINGSHLDLFKKSPSENAEADILKKYPFLETAKKDERNFIARVSCSKFIYKELRKIANNDMMKYHIKKTRFAVDSAVYSAKGSMAKNSAQISTIKTSYCSSDIMITKQKEKLANLDRYLKSRMHEKENGKFISLGTVADAAKKKFSELYAQIKYIESKAESQGKTWLFITLTCPPRMHPNPMYGKNSYDGTSPKDAVKFLNKRYDDAKKHLNRDGISLSKGDAYGFRVIEPHASASPHLHIMLFVNKKDIKQICNRFLSAFDYVGKFSDNELNKFYFDLMKKYEGDYYKAVNIKTDNEKPRKEGESASASSYVTKYLFKYAAIETSFKDMTAKDRKSLKVDAWMACVGARSFSILGLKGYISKWRKFRKTSYKQLFDLYLSDPNEDTQKTIKLILLAKGAFLIKSSFVTEEHSQYFHKESGIHAIKTGSLMHESYAEFIEVCETSSIENKKEEVLNMYGEIVIKEVDFIANNISIISQSVAIESKKEEVLNMYVEPVRINAEALSSLYLDIFNYRNNLLNEDDIRFKNDIDYIFS